jgi:hypothetical protein
MVVIRGHFPNVFEGFCDCICVNGSTGSRRSCRRSAVPIRQIMSVTSSEFVRLVKETCERWGQDMELAPKLPFYFIEAGIGTPNGTDINLPMTSFESFTVHQRDLCRNLLPKATTIFGALAGDDRGVET